MVKHMEDKFKNLGVIFGSLPFDCHIKSLFSRLNGTLSYLNRIIRVLFRSEVQDTPNKCSYLLLSKRLQFIQYGENAVKKLHAVYIHIIYFESYEVKKCINFAAKVASNVKYLKRNHVTLHIKDLDWIKFSRILQLHQASLMYTNLHALADSNAKKINFDLRNKVSQRITIETALIYKQIIIEEQLQDKTMSHVSAAKQRNSIPMNIGNSNIICTNTSATHQLYSGGRI